MKAIVVLFLAVASAVFAEITECPAEQGVDWSIEQLLRHEDCNKFYKCTFGVPIEYSCYGDLYFNLETWECDWRHNVDCTGRNDPATSVAPATTTTPATTSPTTTTPTTTTSTTETPTTTTPTTTTSTTTAPTTTTPTTTTSTTTAPTTTTPTTTTPTTTTTTTTTTPASVVTEASSTTVHAPECEVIVYPNPDEDKDEDKEEEIDFQPNGCPVDPHIHWLLPHETDCNLFYYCVWGEKVMRDCPSALHFNPKLQVCDWPQDAGCTVSVNKHAQERRQLLDQILS